MTSDIGCAGDKGLIGRVEISDVMCLQDQDNDPVNADHDGVQAKGSGSVVVLAPDGVVVMVVVMVFRASESVVDTGNDKE